MIKVAASILSADFAKLGPDTAAICKDGVDFIHVDVMDGHFVPNLTFGAPVIRAIKPYSTVPFDVHLMMDNPENYIDDFITAGANRLTIHEEISANIDHLLDYIHKNGARTGLCLKPATRADSIVPYLDKLDQILIMTVEPGFGGQTFMEDKLPKIAEVKKLIGNRPIDIEVDGGINGTTGHAAVQAGANILVAGNYIFKSDNHQKAIKTLQELK